MTEKKIIAVVGPDGRVTMSFDGFAGESCYDEARGIRARLSGLGIDVECKYAEPKKTTEQETTGMQNEIRHT